MLQRFLRLLIFLILVGTCKIEKQLKLNPYELRSILPYTVPYEQLVYYPYKLTLGVAIKVVITLQYNSFIFIDMTCIAVS